MGGPGPAQRVPGSSSGQQRGGKSAARAGAMTTPPHRDNHTVRYCGREFTPADLDVVRALAASLPTRARIAEAAAAALSWRRPDGQTKAMSARVALNRMAADGLVVLPPPRNTNGNGRIPRHHDPAQPGLFDPEPTTTTDLAAL